MTRAAERLLQRPSVPISYVLLTVALGDEQGADRAALLRRAGIAPQQLDDPQAHISLAAYRELCLGAMEASGDDGLGLAFGLRAPLTAHGIVGFGLMSQPTLRTAFNFAERFGTPLRLPAWDLHFRTEAGAGVIDAVESVRYEPLHVFACDQLLATLATLIRAILPQAHCTVCFDYPEPAHFRRYADALPPARFDSGVTQLRIAEEVLDWPIPSADRIAALQAERACANEMARLNPPTDLVGRVRRILTEAQGGYPDMSAVATQLHVSPRTLVRRLCERGSSFSTLLEEARRRDGVSLLADGTLTTAEIAERLGYSSAASFARAFRKWTGSPPGAWRSRAGADAPAAAAVGRRN